jgi:hypothetical protein
MADPPPDWNEYCTFAERVLVNDVLQVPARADGAAYDYTLTVSPTTGAGTITFRTAKPAGTRVKILYSTLPVWSDSGIVALTDYVNNTADEDLPAFDAIALGETGTLVGPDPLDLTFYYNNIGLDPIVSIAAPAEPANFTETITLSYQVWAEDFKVVYDPHAVEATIDDDTDLDATTYDLIFEQGTYFNVTVPAGIDPLRWFEIAANTESTYVNSAQFTIDFDITVSRWQNVTNSWTNITVSPEINYDYLARQMGTYEWMVVGKDAATIDSAGAAYMTQAFDSKKQIHVRMTGLDIRDALYGVNAPYVMAGASTGERNDYYYDYAAVDLRSALGDDWCTSNPIASSNMLFTGGPRANLGTEYFNEFAMAMFAGSEWVVSNIGQADKIFAISCWDKHSYGSGHAVISVYKDINGTIGFTIWGMDGQDTYFATKWFWDSGIYYLQQENDGVTDIILKITYPPYDPIHPTFSIVERLGTISHKPQHDCPVEEIPV